MNSNTFATVLLFAATMLCVVPARAAEMEVDSLAGLYEAAAQSGKTVRMKPGTYALADYLTDERLEELKADFPQGEGRLSRWFLRFGGSDNTFDFTDVTIEISTDLYPKLPSGYTRCIFIDGNNNTLRNLTIRNAGSTTRGSNGNILSIFGNGNTLDGVQLYVRGSSPYGYGDLLGKGGPNLVGLQKQSGIMVAGQDNTLRRCKVFSRAFGHCFYIQSPAGIETRNITLEDCYAEGITRTTMDMLAEREGMLFDLNFRSVYINRDGRYMVTPGYTKALTEDGFRTYGGVGNVTLRNCTAINTRAGFEIGGTPDSETRTVLEGCQALGTERGFLIGDNTLVRNSRGNVVHGPLLYLRENTANADVDLELVGGMPVTMVHVLATIAGKDHRVRLYTEEPDRAVPALPIMLGFAMPAHAEMSSPIDPAPTSNVTLINLLNGIPVIVSDDATEMNVESPGVVVPNKTSKEIGNARGAWPTGGVAR